jgi:hypothetical protein
MKPKKKKCNKKIGLWIGITSNKFQNTLNICNVVEIMKEKIEKLE